MSFLDNLENNLKALEALEQRDPLQMQREQEAREAAKAEALRVAPHAEALKNGRFTNELLTACRTIGHSMRTLVRFTWTGQTLRLETKDRKVELVPGAGGVEAIYYQDNQEQSREAVDLSGDGECFARQWLTGSNSPEGA